MKRIPILLLMSCVLATGSSADEEHRPAPKVDNFALLDQEGRSHELDYYLRMPGVRGIVLFVHGVGCPLVQKRIPELKHLRDHYQSEGFLFGMLNANSQDTREDIAREHAEFEFDMPVLIDDAQLVATMLGCRRTAEAFVINAADHTLAFRGPVDDRLSYQKEKPEASRHYLADALDAMISGRPISVTEVDESPGCRITLPRPESDAAISYSETIAPLLREKCVRCHTKGGLGPFAMSNYKKVKGWSAMMREVLLARQMPPWQADPHSGQFNDSLALTTEETQSLVRWIEAGASRGEGPDPLDGYTAPLPEWTLGEPDEVIEIPEQFVEAQGVFDYRYVTVESPFDHDVWLRAVQVNPGNTRVLHHVIATSHFPTRDGKRDRERAIAGYAPGMGAYEFPEGTGILLPKGSKIRFQLHYTASGKEESDRSRLGLYVCPEKPGTEFHSDVLINHEFAIPPGDREFIASKSRKLDYPILLYSVNPHMHYRGKWMRYEADLPDGTHRVLLSVPNYNFNWQRDYHFKEPIALPKGTILTVKAAWDNSALNPHNPDPTKEVRWGDQSFEEMFYASYKFTVPK